MYAVVEIAGEQVKVEEGNTVRVNRLQGDVGEKVTLDRVLLLGGQGDPRSARRSSTAPLLRPVSSATAKERK